MSSTLSKIQILCYKLKGKRGILTDINSIVHGNLNFKILTKSFSVNFLVLNSIFLLVNILSARKKNIRNSIIKNTKIIIQKKSFYYCLIVSKTKLICGNFFS